MSIIAKDKECSTIMENCEVAEPASDVGRKFKSRTVVKGHRKDEDTFVVQKGSPSGISASGKAQCALCLELMAGRKEMREHERGEHESGDFRCSGCTKEFS